MKEIKDEARSQEQRQLRNRSRSESRVQDVVRWESSSSLRSLTKQGSQKLSCIRSYGTQLADLEHRLGIKPYEAFWPTPAGIRFPVRKSKQDTLKHKNIQLIFLVFQIFFSGGKGFYCSDPWIQVTWSRTTKKGDSRACKKHYSTLQISQKGRYSNYDDDLLSVLTNFSCLFFLF